MGKKCIYICQVTRTVERPEWSEWPVTMTYTVAANWPNWSPNKLPQSPAALPPGWPHPRSGPLPQSGVGWPAILPWSLPWPAKPQLALMGWAGQTPSVHNFMHWTSSLRIIGDYVLEIYIANSVNNRKASPI